MSAPKGENLTWHVGEVDKAARTAAHGHRGAVLWFTGLSGSGKSTIGHRVERMLIERGAFGKFPRFRVFPRLPKHVWTLGRVSRCVRMSSLPF